MANEGYAQTSGERRQRERRRQAGFRWRERRTGFDRRQSRPPGFRGIYHAFLRRLREDTRLLAFLLLFINLLNLADLSLTLIAIERGIAQEANPVLRPLFDYHPYAAAAFKASLVLGISLVVWDGRRYRRLLETGLLVATLFALVVVYQIGGLMLLT